MYNSKVMADKGSDVYTSQLSLPVLAGQVGDLVWNLNF